MAKKKSFYFTKRRKLIKTIVCSYDFNLVFGIFNPKNLLKNVSLSGAQIVLHRSFQTNSKIYKTKKVIKSS